MKIANASILSLTLSVGLYLLSCVRNVWLCWSEIDDRRHSRWESRRLKQCVCLYARVLVLPSPSVCIACGCVFVCSLLPWYWRAQPSRQNVQGKFDKYKIQHLSFTLFWRVRVSVFLSFTFDDSLYAFARELVASRLGCLPACLFVCLFVYSTHSLHSIHWIFFLYFYNIIILFSTATILTTFRSFVRIFRRNRTCCWFISSKFYICTLINVPNKESHSEIHKVLFILLLIKLTIITNYRQTIWGISNVPLKLSDLCQLLMRINRAKSRLISNKSEFFFVYAGAKEHEIQFPIVKSTCECCIFFFRWLCKIKRVRDFNFFEFNRAKKFK